MRAQALYAEPAIGEFRQNRNSLLQQSMGGGCRNVNRKPTAVSRATPGEVTCLSASRITKLLRLACGHTSGCSRSRSADSDWNVISHCRIHSTMDSPHCQCAIRPRYCSASVSAKSILRRSSRVSSTSTAGSISSASRMAEARSTCGAPEALRTSSGGSSCILLPGMLTYSRSPLILGTTLCTYRRKSTNSVPSLPYLSARCAKEITIGHINNSYGCGADLQVCAVLQDPLFARRNQPCPSTKQADVDR